MTRWAWVEVSSAAIEHNVRQLRQAAGTAQVWAVVKANGYGHGAVRAAHAARAGGADGLCVALVQEGVELRRAGVDGPILVLSEQPPEDLRLAVDHELTLTVYSHEQLQALTQTGARHHPVHLKVDTGMHRVGVAPGRALELADAIGGSPAARLEGVFTHLAVADEPGNPYTNEQLDQFDEVLATLAAAGHHPNLVHAANSAGALAHPRARYDMVRTGIAIYGIAPSAQVAPLCAGLLPALSLHARVSHVKRVAAGARISYGLRHTFDADATVATVPLGYADGVPRRLHACGGAVLIGGQLRPIVGVITMDQLMVDCSDADVQVGAEVVLLGHQGDRQLTPDRWADQLGTIAYEVVCGLSARLERREAQRPTP